MMTDDVKYQIIQWAKSALLGFILVAPLLVVYPFLLPESDPDIFGLTRSLVMFVGKAIAGVVIMAGALNYLDFMTRGDFLGQIEKGNNACAIMGAALCFAVAYILGTA